MSQEIPRNSLGISHTIFLRVAEMCLKPNQIGRFFVHKVQLGARSPKMATRASETKLFVQKLIFFILWFQKTKFQPTDLADFWSLDEGFLRRFRIWQRGARRPSILWIFEKIENLENHKKRKA